MGRVFKNKIVKFIFVIAAIASVGCSKEGDGFAPGVGAEDGGATTTTPPSSNEMTDSQMKIGSQVTSGNGLRLSSSIKCFPQPRWIMRKICLSCSS